LDKRTETLIIFKEFGDQDFFLIKKTDDFFRGIRDLDTIFKGFQRYVLGRKVLFVLAWKWTF